MDTRIVEFVTALRAAGVRISIAESIDALNAIEAAGITQKETFRAALQATLIKEQHDATEFLRLFPLYFGTDAPPPMQQPGGGAMSDEEQEMMQQALQEMLQNMTPEQLAELFKSMMNGQPMDSDDLREMMQGIPFPSMMQSNQQERFTQRAMSRMRFSQLEQLLQELLEELRAAGMSEESLQQIEQEARENMQGLAEQISQQAGQRMLEELQEQRQQQQPVQELMDEPFEYLNDHQLEDLRGIVTRLAAQLRSRAALRQRRGGSGNLDAKRTIRANMRYGGVPMTIHYRQRHLKPKLVVICDLSISMRPVASFMLLLIYALQDQISRTRSFAFIHDLTDISTYFAESRTEKAIQDVMYDVRPPYSYATDLGQSLETLCSDFMDSIDPRTTVIVLGDGRNNHNDPNLQKFELVKRRARRVIWLNPEPPHMWGRYDPGSLNSDMLEYAELCDAVHYVSNLRQLVNAVDTLFVR
jgi:hypothetical protein